MSGSDKKKAALKERQRLVQMGYEQAMQSEGGRAMLWDLLEACGVFRLSFSAQSPHLTSFGEGKRDVGNRVLSRIARSHPQGFVSLMQENAERLEHERQQQRRGSADGPSDASDGSDAADE